MTVSMGDVVAGVADSRVRSLLGGALRTVEEREKREREKAELEAAARRARREAQYTAAASACKGLLPASLQAFGRLDPKGELDEPQAGQRLTLEIVLPGIEPTLRARFGFSDREEKPGWQLTDYALPGIQNTELSWAERFAVRCQDQATALANLARVAAELMNARAEGEG